MRKLVTSVVATAAIGAVLVVVWVLPAAAEPRTIQVTLADGTVVSVTVDVPPGTPLSDITIPVLPSPGEPARPSDPGAPPDGGSSDDDSRDEREPRGEEESEQERGGDEEVLALPAAPGTARQNRRSNRRLRNPDGTPSRRNPTFFDAVPGPAEITPIPNFVIRKFRVPIFLLPIYQAAGIQYGVRWEVLAAINEIETDYGRNLNVSSAGAVGWMQFLPSTWRAYGVDANKDGRKDPYNPVDAIFAAARYLKAAGAERDLRRAIFAYNHADWYVDSVMLRARLIAGIPGDLVGSLTGLTEGHFPVYARARYADDVAEREAERRARRGTDASQEVEGTTRRHISIFAREGAPVVAVNDGVIKAIGEDAERGRYVVLQDAYGNRFTYEHLGSLAESYPVPRQNADAARPRSRRRGGSDDAPTGPASAGRQLDDSDSAGEAARGGEGPTVAVPQRLFADPSRPRARRNGGAEQILDARAGRGQYTTFRNYFSRPFGLDAEDVRLKPLVRGARVIGGTILGRIGQSADGTTAPHVDFSIRPAGSGAPRIDPKPILDGWKLLEATAVYRANGRNALYGDDEDSFSIGQIFLLPKHLLERRVLSDERIEIYPCGRQDIRSGQIDRRVLATLAFLAESGLRPTVTSLKCGHSVYTRSGNISHHSSGNAVDIARLNGVPILGHQEPGGITEQAVRRILQLQGTLRPDQVISLFEIGGPTFAMADHADHIHVGFRPLFGANRRLGRQTTAILGLPGGADWSDLVEQLRSIENPVVPTRPSEFSIDVERRRPRRSSDAHSGE